MWGLHPIRNPFTWVLLTVCCARSVSGQEKEKVWCYHDNVPPPEITCEAGQVIDIDAVYLGDDTNCDSAYQCCWWSPFCESNHPRLQPDLHLYIYRNCHGQPSCAITYRSTVAVIWCPNRHFVDYVRVRYTCKDRTTPVRTTPTFTKAALSTPVPTTTTFTTATDSYRSSPQAQAGEQFQGSALILLIAVPVVVACLILLTIVLVVVCVRRQVNKRRTSRAPTTQRYPAAPNIYSTSDSHVNPAFQPQPEPSAPDLPPSYALATAGTPRTEMTSYSPQTAPIGGGGSIPNGAASNYNTPPDVYAVVNKGNTEYEDVHFVMDENETYGDNQQLASGGLTPHTRGEGMAAGDADRTMTDRQTPETRSEGAAAIRAMAGEDTSYVDNPVYAINGDM